MIDLTFLLDVDNTLLDNDKLKADLDQKLTDVVGREAANQFWSIYENVRHDEEYVDFPATMAEFARARPDLRQDRVRELIDNIAFPEYLYPGALMAITYLSTIGLPVIVSDGDKVFQARKIERSGLAAAVGGRVLLTVHKQAEMDNVFRQFPSVHYALIDDKTAILADIGREYPDRITTVLVCQGKYARLHASPKPDFVVPHISDLRLVPREEFLTDEDQSRR